MKKKIAIFGGGMTGLVAGRELSKQGHEVHVYEASDHLGGLASTFRSEDGFIYDNGPRFIFSTLAEKIGIAHLCNPVKYYEDLFVKGKYYLFPFGFIRNPVYCLSAGIATLTRMFHRKPRHLRDFLQTYYGKRFSGEVLTPLIEKWAGIPAHEVSVDFASRLLPTNISYILHSLLKKLRGGITEDYYQKGRYIVYPRESNAVIFETLANTPGMQVHLHSPLQELHTSKGIITSATVDSKTVEADVFLSTIPIHHLSQFVDTPEPLQHCSGFKYRGIMILFIKLNRNHVLDHLWSWFPESKYRFYRISEFKNALPTLAPKSKTLLAVEFACETTDSLWALSAEALMAVIERDLHALYGITSSEVIGLDLKKSPYAYPVLRASSEVTQRALTHQTPLSNLFIAGRTGMFQYRMLEGCYESAISCVEAISKFIEGHKYEVRNVTPTDRFGRPLIVPH